MNKLFGITRLVGAEKPTVKRMKIVKIVIVMSIIIAIIGVFIVWQRSHSSTSYIQSDKYQALFLTNNQVYFGKLQRLNDSSYRLTDVYYVQSDAQSDATSQTAQDTAKQNAPPTLVKLGDELHGPMDEIIIRDEQVLFWENLKTDGKVTTAINNYGKK